MTLFALAAGALALVIAGGAAAAERSTSMYVGTREVGAITWDHPGFWTFGGGSCYSGGYITRGPRHHRKQINTHYMDGSVGGYSRQRNGGRFVIYMRGAGQTVVAVAVRRSSTRWDVIKGKRRIGYTTGRDGAEAATALATMCSS